MDRNGISDKVTHCDVRWCCNILTDVRFGDCARNAIAVGILSGSKLKALDNKKLSILRPSLTGNLPHLSTIPLSEQRALAIEPKEIAALYFYMRTHTLTHTYMYIYMDIMCIYIIILYYIRYWWCCMTVTTVISTTQSEFDLLAPLLSCLWHLRDEEVGTVIDSKVWLRTCGKCHLVRVLQRVSASQIPSAEGIWRCTVFIRHVRFQIAHRLAVWPNCTYTHTHTHDMYIYSHCRVIRCTNVHQGLLSMIVWPAKAGLHVNFVIFSCIIIFLLFVPPMLSFWKADF